MPPRARPERETPSFCAITSRGNGPLRRSSTSHSGGSARSASNSARVIPVERNSSGAAGRWMPSFPAAVSGFIVWLMGRA